MAMVNRNGVQAWTDATCKLHRHLAVNFPRHNGSTRGKNFKGPVAVQSTLYRASRQDDSPETPCKGRDSGNNFNSPFPCVSVVPVTGAIRTSFHF